MGYEKKKKSVTGETEEFAFSSLNGFGKAPEKKTFNIISYAAISFVRFPPNRRKTVADPFYAVVTGDYVAVQSYAHIYDISKRFTRSPSVSTG